MILLIISAGMLIGFLLRIPRLRALEKEYEKDPGGVRVKALLEIQDLLVRILKRTGSSLTVIGRENIQEGAALYVGNHRSFFDVVAVYPLLPPPTGFIAKKELESWFTLPRWVRLAGCLFLDRKDPREGLKTIREAIGLIGEGVSIFVFPEGTRNRGKITDCLEFHEGSMRIASKTGCPVVPVAITGTAEMFEAHFPWITPSHVTVEFGKPFYIQELPDAEKKHSGRWAREEIVKMLDEEQKRRDGGC